MESGVGRPDIRQNPVGEPAITVPNPEGFAIGRGVHVVSKTQRNFLSDRATILNERFNYFTFTRSMNADFLMSDGGFAATVFPVIISGVTA